MGTGTSTGSIGGPPDSSDKVSMLLLTNFEMKDAFVEGAKAARSGVSFAHSLFGDYPKLINRSSGYLPAFSGKTYEPVWYQSAA